MLRGSAPARVDSKGRLKLPAGFRSLIEPKWGSEFYVTSVKGDSVHVYPLEIWERIEERLSHAPSMHPAVIRFRTAVNYYGANATMDSQGRILIHTLLRDKADARGDVTVLGQSDHLEVWNRAAFEQRIEAAPVTDEDLGVLSTMGL